MERGSRLGAALVLTALLAITALGTPRIGIYTQGERWGTLELDYLQLSHSQGGVAFAEPEGEYPDSSTVGHFVSRTNARNHAVWGSFGCRPDGDYVAQAGGAFYDAPVEAEGTVYLRLRCSRQQWPAVDGSCQVWVDDQLQGSIVIPQTGLWESFAWTNWIAIQLPVRPVLSGIVVDAFAEPLPGVNVALTGAGAAVTDAQGLWSSPVPFGWSGSVLPSGGGWVYEPEQLDFANVQVNVVGVDFVASPGAEPMDFERLRARAATLATGPWGGAVLADCETLGDDNMDFQECLAIPADALLDYDGHWVKAYPVCGADRYFFDPLMIDGSGDGVYEPVGFADCGFVFPSPPIDPPVNPSLLEPDCRRLSNVAIGHRLSAGSYPQYFSFKASEYLRAAHDPPATMGSTMRIGYHNLFGLDPTGTGEDFPRARELFVDVPETDQTRLLAIGEAEAFVLAQELELRPGPVSEIAARLEIWPRRALDPTVESCGPLAVSSMFLHDERDGEPGGEAHDADYVVLGYDLDGDGLPELLLEDRPENPPFGGGVVRTDYRERLAGFGYGSEARLVYLALEQRDREAAHYAQFASAEYELRPCHDFRLAPDSPAVHAELLEEPTSEEWFDNLVLACRLDEPLAPGVPVAFAWDTRCYPWIDSDLDGLADVLEDWVGTLPGVADSDGDGFSDRLELLHASDPMDSLGVPAPRRLEYLEIGLVNGSVQLSWPPVTRSLGGRPLPNPPVYRVRASGLVDQPFVEVAVTADTVWTDPLPNLTPTLLLNEATRAVRRYLVVADWTPPAQR